MKVLFEDTLKKDLKNNNKVIDNYYNKSNLSTVKYPAYKPTKNIIDDQLNNQILIKPIKNKYDESFTVKPPPSFEGNIPVLPNFKKDLKFWRLVC
jgi:hypothetical protein